MGIGSMKSRMHAMHIGGGGGSAAVTGSFTPVFGDPPFLGITFSYVVQNGVVTLWIDSSTALLDTSTVNTFSTTSGQLPAAIRPTATRLCPCVVVDNGVGVYGRVAFSTAGLMSFAIGVVSGTGLTLSLTGFTASGDKGLQPNFCVTYPL